jgi:hypothetical protein
VIASLAQAGFSSNRADRMLAACPNGSSIVAFE